MITPFSLTTHILTYLKRILWHYKFTPILFIWIVRLYKEKYFKQSVCRLFDIITWTLKPNEVVQSVYVKKKGAQTKERKRKKNVWYIVQSDLMRMAIIQLYRWFLLCNPLLSTYAAIIELNVHFVHKCHLKFDVTVIERRRTLFQMRRNDLKSTKPKANLMSQLYELYSGYAQ